MISMTYKNKINRITSLNSSVYYSSKMIYAIKINQLI
jgi:hypothetical protein